MKPTFETNVTFAPRIVAKALMEASLVECETPFLRWQVRVATKRPSSVPLFDGDLLVGHSVGSAVEVQKLVGWGETKEQAEAMARRNAK
jgi:hypothetical protein